WRGDGVQHGVASGRSSFLAPLGRMLAAEHHDVGRMRMSARVLLLGVACAFATGACHRLYEIQGTIQVVPSAVRKARLPSVLCSGPGGSLETSAVHGHPTERPREPGGASAAVIFCSEPQ